jgi:polyhydroxybutyrate depolymerase
MAVLACAVVILMAGCPAVNQGLERHTLQHAGKQRVYHVYTPAAERVTGPLPLVIALHRFVEDGPAMARITGFNDVAEREGLLVAYPDGLMRNFEAYGPGDRDDLGFLRAMVDAIAAKHPVDRRRIYATGASNGGFMALRLACEASDLVAAVAPVMATLPANLADACRDSGPVPVLMIHGTADTLIPYDATEIEAGPGNPRGVLPVPETAALLAARNGCTGETTEIALSDTDPKDGTLTFLVSHGCDGASEVLLYRVEGGGHTWPGGREPWPKFIVGKTSRDFSATETIWEFFSRHSLPE